MTEAIQSINQDRKIGLDVGLKEFYIDNSGACGDYVRRNLRRNSHSLHRGKCQLTTELLQRLSKRFHKVASH